VTSHEVLCTTEFYLQPGYGPIGLIRHRQKSLFPTHLPRLAKLPAPVPLRDRVHPLMRAVLFRVRDRSIPAHHPQVLCTFLGVWLSIATSIREVHLPARFPPEPMFHPQRFSRSRRFTPSRTLQAYFILLPRPRFTLQGLIPTAEPTRFSPYCSLLLLNDFRLQPGCPNCPAPVIPTSGR
jgi:hypothetical protein